jgi:ketosteroid isomerase-like protein
MIKLCSLFALVLITTVSSFAQKDMKADIMAANQKFMDAFAQGATTMSTYYSTDAQLLPPNMESVKGGTAIGTFWKGAYDSGVKKAKLATEEATQNGNQVFEVGQYTLYGADDTQLDTGKYVVIWKKEGGQWKLHRDIWNTSMAPSMAAK